MHGTACGVRLVSPVARTYDTVMPPKRRPQLVHVTMLQYSESLKLVMRRPIRNRPPCPLWGSRCSHIHCIGVHTSSRIRKRASARRPPMIRAQPCSPFAAPSTPNVPGYGIVANVTRILKRAVPALVSLEELASTMATPGVYFWQGMILIARHQAFPSTGTSRK